MRLFSVYVRHCVLVFWLSSSLLSQISGPYALSFGTAGDEQAHDFCVDSDGSYVTAFSFSNPLSFPGGTNPGQSVLSNGLRDSGLVRYDFLGNLQWALSWGGSGGADHPVTVVCDPKGFIYVAGVFEGSMDINPRFGTEIVTSNGFTDVYLIKLTKSGNFVWGRTFGGTLADAPQSIAIAPDDGLLLAITFRSAIDVNPNPAVTQIANSRGGQDIMLMRLTDAGNLAWNIQLGGPLDEGTGGVSAVFDSLGNLTVAGGFKGSLNLDPGVAPAIFTSQGSHDIFLATYDTQGKLVSGRAIQGPGDATIQPGSLAVDASDNLYLMGNFRLTVDVDTSLGQRVLTARQNTSDFFLASYTPTNTLRWANAVGGLSNDTAFSMRLDRSGNLVVAGKFGGVMNIASGSSGAINLQAKGVSGATDGFVAKYRILDGSAVSGFALGAPLSGSANRNAVVAASMDTMGNIVVTGNLFGQNVDFGLGTGAEVPRSSAGGSDFFLAAYTWRNALRQPSAELDGPILRATTNAASFLPGPVVPGGLASLFGLNISTRMAGFTTPDIARSLPIGTKLCNTEVVFTREDGTEEWKAPILFCSDSQINYQVPAGLPGGHVTLKVVVDGTPSNDLEALVQSDDIGVFMRNPATKVAAMTFAFGVRRGEPVLPTNSITACDIMEVFVTGLGAVTPQLPPDGEAAGAALRTQGNAKVVLYDDGTQGRLPGFEVPPRFVEFRSEDDLILYTGLSTEFAGLYQINFRWPNPQASGTPLQLRLNQGDYPAFLEFRGRRSQQFILTVRYSGNPSPCLGGFF